jgi:hypothetical protein
MEKRSLARTDAGKKRRDVTAPTTTKRLGPPPVGAGAIEWVPAPPKESKSLLSRLFPRDR